MSIPCHGDPFSKHDSGNGAKDMFCSLLLVAESDNATYYTIFQAKSD